MSKDTDNLLKRFSAFWLGIVLIVGFVILGLAFGWLAPKNMDKATVAAAQNRSEIRKSIDAEQVVALNAEALEAAREQMIPALVESKPSKGSMPVPTAGSPEDEALAEPVEEEAQPEASVE